MLATHSRSFGVPELDASRDCSLGVQSIAEILPVVLARLLSPEAAQLRIGSCMDTGHWHALSARGTPVAIYRQTS